MICTLLRWKGVFHLPPVCQLKTGVFKMLGQNPVGTFHLAIPSFQLAKGLLDSVGLGAFVCDAAQTSPYGRESLLEKGSLPQGGAA